MSASISPTRLPAWARARARLTATVDLPTPPLPLATARTVWMFGKAIFSGGPPGGRMVVLQLGVRVVASHGPQAWLAVGAADLGSGRPFAHGATKRQRQHLADEPFLSF